MRGKLPVIEEDMEDTDDSVLDANKDPQGYWRKKKNILMVGIAVMAFSALGAGLYLGPHYVYDGDSSLSAEQTKGNELASRALSVAGGQRKEQFYTSPSDDPIPVSIRLIHPSIIDGYPDGDEGCAELTEDIYNASAILANEVIKRQARCYGSGDDSHDCGTRRYVGGDAFGGWGAEATLDTPGAKGEDSFETNNQEAGVDEADIVKSDGQHVFTGYGNYLVVWNANTGKELSRTKMPKKTKLTWAEGAESNYYDAKVHISGLLLDSASKRIVVIISGYGASYRSNYLNQPALGGKGDTRVLIYDISSIPSDGSELRLIASEDMDGEYFSARKINSVAHIVRQSSVQHYRHIEQRLTLYSEQYAFPTKEVYIKRATEKAKRLLEGFARRLTEELKATSGGSDCSAVTKVALYASGGDDGNSNIFPDSFVSGGILNHYLQISSFDMALPPIRKARRSVKAKTAGSFFPSSDLEVYASKDVLAVAGRGYDRDVFAGSWGQSTHFLTFKLHGDGSAPTGLSIGMVPGYLLNQFSMDEHDGYFRVATTQQASWDCVPIDPDTISRRSDYWSQCKWEMISESKSRLSVMKFPEEYGEMKTIKVIDNLGIREEIKSARFFDDRAYIVTFMKTDPLYVIDLRDPEKPVVTDDLKISGFSSYLHPVGKDRLLAIGKEADEATGRVTGFQVTLFDVSDLEDTKVLQRSTIKQRWASSLAESDHLAFRYLPQSKMLILPVSVSYTPWLWDEKGEREWEPFDGFKVYYVSDEKIESRLSIGMMRPGRIRRGCWSNAYLPARSMVFKGNLSVIKGHGYASYNLETGKLRWKRNLDQNLPKSMCVDYWGGYW